MKADKITTIKEELENNGAIIFGYPAIGKSSVAGPGKLNLIDLESGAFSNNGEKQKGWEVLYANVAIHLAQQGYNVLVSTHPEIIKEISSRYGEVGAIFPSLNIADKWLARLNVRCQKTENTAEYEKNQRALNRAQEHYYDDISDLIEICYTLRIPYYKLITEDYDLNYVLENLLCGIRVQFGSDKFRVCPRKDRFKEDNHDEQQLKD